MKLFSVPTQVSLIKLWFFWLKNVEWFLAVFSWHGNLHSGAGIILGKRFQNKNGLISFDISDIQYIRCNKAIPSISLVPN